MNCPNCNGEIKSGIRFCPHCGAPITGAEKAVDANADFNTNAGADTNTNEFPQPPIYESYPGVYPPAAQERGNTPVVPVKKKRVGVIVGVIIAAVAVVFGSISALAGPTIVRKVYGEASYYINQEKQILDHVVNRDSLSEFAVDGKLSWNLSGVSENYNGIINGSNITYSADVKNDKNGLSAVGNVSINDAEKSIANGKILIDKNKLGIELLNNKDYSAAIDLSKFSNVETVSDPFKHYTGKSKKEFLEYAYSFLDDLGDVLDSDCEILTETASFQGNDFNAVTFYIDRNVVNSAVSKLSERVKEDEFKEMFSTFYKQILVDSGKDASDVDRSFEKIYKEFVDELESGNNSLNENAQIVYTVYYSHFNSIIARELKLERNNKTEYDFVVGGYQKGGKDHFIAAENESGIGLYIDFDKNETDEKSGKLNINFESNDLGEPDFSADFDLKKEEILDRDIWVGKISFEIYDSRTQYRFDITSAVPKKNVLDTTVNLEITKGSKSIEASLNNNCAFSTNADVSELSELDSFKKYDDVEKAVENFAETIENKEFLNQIIANIKETPNWNVLISNGELNEVQILVIANELSDLFDIVF